MCAAGRIAHTIPVLSLDVMDISGETQSDITHNILKTRMDERGFPVPTTVITELQNDLDKINSQREGGYCGSCYGGVEPEGGCCNTCEDVRQAYVNRGWSFNRPDSIEQVVILVLMRISRRSQRANFDSACKRAGLRSSRSRRPRDATSLVVCA